VATGGDVCALLGPGDFSAAGIAGAHTPTESPDGSGGNYCVYSGRSSATGGIEFDAFVIDGPSTYQTIVGEVGPVTSISAADLPGADEAGVNLADEGGSASIVVRKGNLSFDIGFQAGSNARTQLIALAALVLQRGSGLG
jgi:hypothetical protein